MQMAALDGEDAALQRALAESMQTTGGLACKIAVLTKLPTSRAALAQQQHCMEVSSCRLFSEVLSKKRSRQPVVSQ